MAAAKVRADYEQLKELARQMSRQAQTARQSLGALQQRLDTLQGGDWVGQGANAFYQEMAEQLLPAFRRLADALEAASQSAAQISAIMAQAEADAARVLRGDGQAGAATVSSAGGRASGIAAAFSAA